MLENFIIDTKLGMSAISQTGDINEEVIGKRLIASEQNANEKVFLELNSVHDKAIKCLI